MNNTRTLCPLKTAINKQNNKAANSQMQHLLQAPKTQMMKKPELYVKNSKEYRKRIERKKSCLKSRRMNERRRLREKRRSASEKKRRNVAKSRNRRQK